MAKKNMSVGFRYFCVASLLSLLVLLLILSHPSAALAQAYTIYDAKPANAVEARVLRVSIVCRDVDGTSKLWAKALSLPVPEIMTTDPDPQSFLDFHSTVPNATFKRAIVQLENTQVELLQPVGNVASPEAEYLKNHPAGVRRVLFAIADPNAPERFAKLGLTKRTQGGRDLYVESSADMLNVPTEWVVAKDHNALGEIAAPTEVKLETLPPTLSGGLRHLMQVGTVARELKARSDEWAAILGAPAPDLSHRSEGRWIYHGALSNAPFLTAFVPFGEIEVEVVGSTGDTSSSFAEYLAKRGDGVQHVAFSVDDMDAAVAHFQAVGLEISMMAPLQPQQPHYNIHMMETADKLGVDVELFHRVVCCDRDAYFNGNLHRLDDNPSPR
jgi:hypothetical protein